MKTMSMFCISLIFCVTGCANNKQPDSKVIYRPAMAQNKNQTPAIKYVPVAVPGQLMQVHKRVDIRKLPNNIHHRLVGIAAINAANSKALQQPALNSYINSIMTFNYMDGALYQIYCAPLRVTDIQFQEGEQILSVAAGDTLRWQVSKTYSGSDSAKIEHLFIKPIDSGLTTSIVITTSMRTYHLILHAIDKTYMASVRWQYPDSEDFVTRYPKSHSEVASPQDLNLNDLDFGYRITLLSGSRPKWTPTMVFNDGQKTYIKFPNGIQEIPTLFIGSKRNIIVTNYRVKGNYYIIDRVVDDMQLRLGQTRPTVIQINHQ